jgi:hypothetical protein
MMLGADLSLFLGTSSATEKGFLRVFATIGGRRRCRPGKAFAQYFGIGFKGLNIPTKG